MPPDNNLDVAKIVEQIQLKKYISVTLDLNNNLFDGELSPIDSSENRKELLSEYFFSRYGEGKGKLYIEVNQSKVYLKWQPPKVDSEAEDFHKEALKYAKNKQYQEAINCWIKAISCNSEDPDYYYNLGIAFFQIKNYQESIENLLKAISLCPIYHKAYLVLGTVYLKIRKYEKAEIYLRESINFFQNNPFAFLNLGAVYSILKKYDKAIHMFQKTLHLSPNEVRAYFGLGKLYNIQGEKELARECFQKVIELEPKGVLASHAKRAMVFAPLDTSSISKVSEIDLKNIEKFYQNGYKAYLLTDYQKAIESYEIYVQNKPDDDLVWFSLGEAYLRANKVNFAINAFKRAIEINSNKAIYYKALGLALDYEGNAEEAAFCLRKAIQFGKNDSITNTLLGKQLINLENYAEAISLLENALRMNPTNLLCKYYLAIGLSKTGEVNSAINLLHEIIKSPIETPLKEKAESFLTHLS